MDTGTIAGHRIRTVLAAVAEKRPRLSQVNGWPVLSVITAPPELISEAPHAHLRINRLRHANN